MSKSKVMVFLPSDSQYDYAMIKSIPQAIMLHPDEGSTVITYMAFKNIVGARNQAVKGLLQSDCTHILFIDSDQILPELTLSRLLQHDVDIVGGLYCRKLAPHTPLTFMLTPQGYRWEFPKHRLQEVDAIATGCLLIKRRVFEIMTKPPFFYEPASVYGVNDPYLTTTEDISFCNHAKKAGIKIHVDGSLHVGHICQAVVWPVSADQSKLQAFGAGGAQ